MNIAMALLAGAAGMVSGWFIPLMALKTTEYMLKKNGGTLPPDTRFTSPLLKLVCLISNGALWAAVGMFSDNFFHTVLLLVILLDALIIAIIDIRIRLIPNEAVLIMLLTGLILQISFNGIVSLISAIATMFVVMAAFIALGYLMGLKTIGAGDVKLAGAMGLTLGFPHILYGLIGMSLVLLVWCSGGLITRKLNLKSMLAFAPFMMAGMVFAIVANISGY